MPISQRQVAPSPKVLSLSTHGHGRSCEGKDVKPNSESIPMSAHVLVQCSCAAMLNAICLGKATFPFFVIYYYLLIQKHALLR